MGPVEELLYYTAQALHDCSLSNTPACQEVAAWMRRPHPGDVVIELSTVISRAPRPDALGRLVSIAWEVFTDEDDPAERYWDRVTTISSLSDPTKTTRWTNASFARIPGYHLRHVMAAPHTRCAYCDDIRRPAGEP